MGKGWEVRAGFKGLALFSGRAVEYQGRLYPGELHATCIRDDGLEVELAVRVEADGGPIPTRAVISRLDGFGGVDRLPFVTLARQAAAAVAFDPTEERGTWTHRGPTTNELQRVADLYREAAAAGEPVTKAVRDGLQAQGIYRSTSTVSKLIYRARRTSGSDGETYLPATDPGRKRA